MEAHAQAGPKVAKFDRLPRTGPKKVLQTRSYPATRLRSLNRLTLIRDTTVSKKVF